jgi:predicted Rossmann fold nucleotide-binding protein DprA/Smf involved in DNA uptake
MAAKGENESGWRPTCLTVARSQCHWAQQMFARLANNAPSQLWVIGSTEILEARKIGLFCSVGFPGDVSTTAGGAARKLCEEDAAVISGFHSPVEKECLRILLDRNRPLILCPARTIARMRIPRKWKPALEDGRLMILSRFERSPRRVDTSSARRRNELVAALSDEILIIHAEPGGAIERISNLTKAWDIPRTN